MDGERRRQRLHLMFKVAIAGTTALVTLGITLLIILDRWEKHTDPVTPHQITATRGEWKRFYQKQLRDQARCLYELGLEPEQVLMGRANRNQVLTFSHLLFEPDPQRSYTMRPGVGAVWYSLPIFPMAPMLGPDNPQARQSVLTISGHVLPDSEIRTNSWGCRGPEPDKSAPLRILVAGDSIMQGIFLRDSETPSARLQFRLGGPKAATVLNAGLYGYSPDQYYYTVTALAPKFKPHIAVVSLFANDLDEGDVEEQAGWVTRTMNYCRTRNIPSLFVAVPSAEYVTGESSSLLYPEAFRRVVPSDEWLDLRDAMSAAQPGVSRWKDSPLFLGRINDVHLSDKGGRSLGRVCRGEGHSAPGSTTRDIYRWSIRNSGQSGTVMLLGNGPACRSSSKF